MDNCPLCDNGNQPSYVVLFTIIDHSTYTLKKGKNAGKVITNHKKIVAFKTTARSKILKRKERLEGDLTYANFEVTRYNSQENNTGWLEHGPV